ncbi:MAG: hypothetical protein HZB91_10695 [Elusimicrobia bacterium]|nr:hypothetical protein [Elusimicrobiota bacterium]
MDTDRQWLDDFHKELDSFLRETRGWKGAASINPAEVKALKARLDDMERSLIARDERLGEIRERIEKAAEAQRQADSALHDARQVQAEAQTDRKALAEERAFLQREAQRLEKLETDSRSSLEAGRKELAEERRLLHSECSRAQQEAEAAQKQADEVLAEVRRLQAEMEADRKAMAADRAALLRETHRLQALEAQASADLEAGRAELQEERRRLHAENARSRQEAEAAQLRAEEALAEARRLEKISEQDRAALDADRGELEEERRRLHAENARSRQEAEAAQQQADEARSESRRLDRLSAQARQEAETAQRQADAVLAEARRLQAEAQADRKAAAGDRAALEAGRRDLEDERRRLIAEHALSMEEVRRIKTASEADRNASLDAARQESRQADGVRLSAEAAIQKALDLEKELLARHKDELEAWRPRPVEPSTQAPSAPRRRALLAVLAAMGLAAAAVAAWSLRAAGMPRSYAVPFSHPTGLAWKGSELWVSDWYEGALFRMKLEKGRLVVLDRQAMAGSHITAMAVGDDALFIADSWKKTISMLAPSGGGWSVTKTWPSPGPNPSALYADGKYLYSADSSTRKIYKHLPDDGLTVLQTFRAAFPPVAVYPGKDFLWVADGEHRVLRRSRWDRDAIQGEALAPPEIESGREPLSCMTKTEGKFWFGRDGSPVLLEVPERSLRPVQQ